ncbi:hypothetical protein HT031_004149 [Scenedesmus sp. PABB004]|nr:hypothetical protein HT031_004149 [Scenedesmus sp. PABB004]
MSRPGSKKAARVVWDEDNLAANTEIQKEYSGVKIAEPKTPYHAPLPPIDGDDEDMRPLELDDDDEGGGAPGDQAAETAGAKAPGMTAFDYVMRNGGAEFTPPGPSRPRGAGSSDGAGAAAPEPQQQQPAPAAAAAQQHAPPRLQAPSTSLTSSGSEGCGDGDKKRRFEAMRRQHYNMKQALQQARRLLASQDDDVGGAADADVADEADSAGGAQQADGGSGDASGGEGGDSEPVRRGRRGRRRAGAPAGQQQEQQEQQPMERDGTPQAG